MTLLALPKLAKMIATLEDRITDTSAQLEEARTRRERSPLNKRLHHDRRHLMVLSDLHGKLKRRNDARA